MDKANTNDLISFHLESSGSPIIVLAPVCHENGISHADPALPVSQLSPLLSVAMGHAGSTMPWPTRATACPDAATGYIEVKIRL